MRSGAHSGMAASAAVVGASVVPANEIIALNEFADSMYFSWWPHSRQQAEGFDPADAVRLAAVADVRVPMVSHRIGSTDHHGVHSAQVMHQPEGAQSNH
jgi:hypothetical protein